MRLGCGEAVCLGSREVDSLSTPEAGAPGSKPTWVRSGSESDIVERTECLKSAFSESVLDRLRTISPAPSKFSWSSASSKVSSSSIARRFLTSVPWKSRERASISSCIDFDASSNSPANFSECDIPRNCGFRARPSSSSLPHSPNIWVLASDGRGVGPSCSSTSLHSLSPESGSEPL